MGKIAFIFAGQGAQYAGMGKDLYENYEDCKKIFMQADDALGFSIRDICFDQDDTQLNKTENTQPAILTMSIAALRLIESQGIKPDITAGLSLGEYSALVCSGALEFKDAVKLVRQRGRFMEQAVPEGNTGMKVILGLSLADIQDICRLASDQGIVEVANLNCPGQIAIAGQNTALSKAEFIAKKKGAKRIISLGVTKPFHTSMLSSACIPLRQQLDKITFRQFNIPVITNVTGECIKHPSQIKGLLERQIKSPVFFEKSIRNMIAYGVDTFVELGPGKVLSGFVKRVDRKLNVYNVEDKKSFVNTLKYLKNM